MAATGCGETPDSSATVYRVRIEQCAGSDTQRATAVAVAPDLVATVAHSFEEAHTITIHDAMGEPVTGELIYLDPAKDLALLRLSETTGSTLELAAPDESGPVTITTFADEDGPTVKDADILDLVQATLDGEGPRAAVRLGADIKPGDSGAPVLNADGEMVGLVFATVRGKDVGWAVSAVEVRDAVDLVTRERPGALPLACPS